MADIAGAIARGLAVGQSIKAHREASEQNKLETQLLKHRIDALKIDDALREYDVKKQHAQMQFESEQGTPQGAYGYSPGVPVAPPDTMPGVTMPGPTAGVAERGAPLNPPVVQEPALPDVVGGGAPGFARQPLNLEQQIAQRNIEARAKAFHEPYNVGVGQERRFGPDLVGQGMTPLITVRPDTTIEERGAPGQPATVIATGAAKPERPIVAPPNSVIFDPKSGAVIGRGMGRIGPDVTGIDYTTPTPTTTRGAPRTFAPTNPNAVTPGDRNKTRLQQQWKEENAAALRQYGAAVRAHAAEVNNAILTGQPVGPAPTQPEVPTFEDWQKKKGLAGGKAGASTSTIRQQGDRFFFTGPDGVTQMSAPTLDAAQKAVQYYSQQGAQ
jgi:hypothetical protein